MNTDKTLIIIFRFQDHNVTPYKDSFLFLHFFVLLLLLLFTVITLITIVFVLVSKLNKISRILTDNTRARVLPIALHFLLLLVSSFQGDARQELV